MPMVKRQTFYVDPSFSLNLGTNLENDKKLNNYAI